MQKKINYGAAFALASTWFGLHCGGGFATGAQGVLYFTKYGAWELLTTLISAAFMAIYAYTVWDYGRVAKTYSYRATYNSLYAPFDKIFASIHELLYLIILVMAMGGVFSGAANVTIAIFPQINYIVAAMSVAIIVLFLTFFGERILFKFASFLSILLISSVIIVTVAGVAVSPDHIFQVVNNWEVGDKTFWDALKPAIIYASFQSTVMIGTIGMVRNLRTPGDTKAAGIFGFFVNAGLMILVSTMMLGFYPEVVGQKLPIKHILDGIGIPALTYIYYIALYLACLTTGMTLVGSLVKRFEHFGAKVISDQLTRRRIYAILIIFGCFGISLVGLLTIIGKGYGMVGYLALPLVYIPTLVIAPIKKRRIMKGQ